MQRQEINIGTAPTGAGGDTTRSTAVKINAMMIELYNFLAGLVKVSSPTDSTAGRIPTVGWMGLGTSSIALSAPGSINAIRNTGFYYSAATGDTPESYGFLMHTSAGPSDGIQDFHGVVSGRKYTRTLFNGSWSAWVPVYTTASAVTDPASSGLMSMAVVNGFTVSKYANGQCHISGSLPSTGSIGVNGVVALSATIPTVLLAANNPPIFVQLQPEISYDHFGVVSAYIATTVSGFITSIGYVARNGVASPQAFNARLSVWGVWK